MADATCQQALNQPQPAFPCDQCGRCCQSVWASTLTQYLDRGDGTCKYFEDIQRTCSIYATRPDICRVDVQYQLHYVQHYSWQEFVRLNVQVCEQLKAI